jgi:secreted trypsin-like serine protease
MVRNFVLITSFLVCLSHGAIALVGKTEAPGSTSSHTVMVLKRQSSGSSFCSGVAIAPRVVLTAAHCVHRGSGVAIYLHSGGSPKLLAAVRVAVHPGFRVNAIRTRQRSIDLALVELEQALPAGIHPAKISADTYASSGLQLRIAGFGLQREGVERSAGRLRSTLVTIRPPLSKILLWLRSSNRPYGGACTGDSGGPVFSSDGSRLVAITVWARGKGKRRCGELTQAIRLAPQRGWINRTLARWHRR